MTPPTPLLDGRGATKYGITLPTKPFNVHKGDVREIFSIVVSTLGAGPFLYRVWFRHGNADIQIHWANIESIIPFCPEMSNKYNTVHAFLKFV